MERVICSFTAYVMPFAAVINKKT